MLLAVESHADHPARGSEHLPSFSSCVSAPPTSAWRVSARRFDWLQGSNCRMRSGQKIFRAQTLSQSCQWCSGSGGQGSALDWSVCMGARSAALACACQAGGRVALCLPKSGRCQSRISMSRSSGVVIGFGHAGFWLAKGAASGLSSSIKLSSLRFVEAR